MGWQSWSACSVLSGCPQVDAAAAAVVLWCFLRGCFVLGFWPLMRIKCSLGLGLIVYSCDHAVLKTVNQSSLFKLPPFCHCTLLQVLCGYFGQIHLHVSHMTWCHLDFLLFSHRPLLLSSLLRKYRPVWASCKVLPDFQSFSFTTSFQSCDISLVLTLPHWTETKNKPPNNNNLTFICFVFLQRWSWPPVTIKLLVSQFTLKALKMEYSLN